METSGVSIATTFCASFYCIEELNIDFPHVPVNIPKPRQQTDFGDLFKHNVICLWSLERLVVLHPHFPCSAGRITTSWRPFAAFLWFTSWLEPSISKSSVIKTCLLNVQPVHVCFHVPLEE